MHEDQDKYTTYIKSLSFVKRKIYGTILILIALGMLIVMILLIIGIINSNESKFNPWNLGYLVIYPPSYLILTCGIDLLFYKEEKPNNERKETDNQESKIDIS